MAYIFGRLPILMLTLFSISIAGVSLANAPSAVYGLEGVLEIRMASQQQTAEEIIQYAVNIEEEFYYLLFFDDDPINLNSGDRVLISSATLVIDQDGSKKLLLFSQDVLVLEEANAQPSSFGPQNTIVFLVNFQDAPTLKPWTLDQVNSTVFSDINNMFYESSYHQTTMVGRVIGWYTLPINGNTSCTPFTDSIVTQSEAAARQAGIDLTPYKRRVYVFPRNDQCHWSGLGTVGTPGAYSKAWLNGYNVTSITGHELGHNFGLRHARRLVCTSNSNEGDCSIVDYGDGSDIMGSGRATHFNAFQKDILGWLNYQSSPPIQTVTTSGNYNIFPYELFNNDVKALKVLKRVNANGSKDYYYLEFRQGIGYDVPLASCGTSCDYTKGVLIHQGNDTNPNSSDLLDLSPTDNNTTRVALLPGKSFTDSTVGVTFTVVSVSATSASVNIRFGNTPPPPPPPLEGEIQNGVPVPNLQGGQGSETFYYIDVPAGTSLLTLKIEGGSGDADLYVRYNEKPTVSNYQCRPYTSGNNETCSIPTPQTGKYFLMLRGFTNYSGVTLTGTY